MIGIQQAPICAVRLTHHPQSGLQRRKLALVSLIPWA
ncbi:uncharacterized protein METZ01_LOCUS179723 [marine metagenome]|uniref:Uncharacterized protein n=1 Tax=marine metagenome TaxID=408172 RepID=A0A382CLW4_9ZZZZ